MKDENEETLKEINSLSKSSRREVLKRLFKFAYLFKRQFIIAIIFAIILSIVNVFLPRMLQFYMDHYLSKQSTSIKVILGFAAVYAIGTIIKAIVQFIQEFVFSMGAERTLEEIRSCFTSCILWD